MRLRESFLFYSSLNKANMAKQLAEHIPKQALVLGDAQFFIVAQNAHLNYEPLPFFIGIGDSGVAVPPGVWLVISSDCVDKINATNSEYLRNRRLIFKSRIFPDLHFDNPEYFIYSPTIY